MLLKKKSFHFLFECTVKEICEMPAKQNVLDQLAFLKENYLSRLCLKTQKSLFISLKIVCEKMIFYWKIR